MRSASPLPIDESLGDILAALERANTAVLTAPPGAGKTTRVAPAMIEVMDSTPGWGAERARQGRPLSIYLLQPRRIAARAAAARIADERGWTLGGEVGYQIRFENRTGPRTRLHVLTEGILARRILGDACLEDAGCVILDEFHERSIHTDLALALTREIQSAVREDLRILVMSATLDPGPVAEFLGSSAGAPGAAPSAASAAAPAQVLQCRGRLFPIEIEYLERPDSSPVWDKAARALESALGGEGHILVFLPGIGEIRRTESLVREMLGVGGGSAARPGSPEIAGEFEIHILHSSISNAAQDAALRPSARRKIILATNIAETSITIDGVRTVIDTGLARLPIQDSRLGIDRLEMRRISLASAEQRAGRAGRTAPGRCLRLWTRAEHSVLDEREVPEIHRVDLASTLLTLRSFGVREPAKFGWFEPPRPEMLERAERLLWMLGAVDARGAITPKGRRLASLPIHPRLGCLLLAGAADGLLRETAALAALLSEKDILLDGQPAASRRRSAEFESDSDLLERLERLENADRDPAGLDPQAVRAVRRTQEELIRLMRDSG